MFCILCQSPFPVMVSVYSPSNCTTPPPSKPYTDRTASSPTLELVQRPLSTPSPKLSTEHPKPTSEHPKPTTEHSKPTLEDSPSQAGGSHPSEWWQDLLKKFKLKSSSPLNRLLQLNPSSPNFHGQLLNILRSRGYRRWVRGSRHVDVAVLVEHLDDVRYCISLLLFLRLTRVRFLTISTLLILVTGNVCKNSGISVVSE